VAGPTGSDAPSAGKADGFDPSPDTLEDPHGDPAAETDNSEPRVELLSDSRVAFVTEAASVAVEHVGTGLFPQDRLTLTVRTETGAEASFDTMLAHPYHAEAHGVPAETVRDYDYVLWPTPLDQVLPDEHVDAFHHVEDEIARVWGDTRCAITVPGCIPGGVNGANTGCEGETIVSMALSAFQAPEDLCEDVL
jgi:hypothetical protein